MMIKFIIKAFPKQLYAPNLIQSNHKLYSTNHSLSKIIQNTNLQLINPKSTPNKSNGQNKQNMKNGSVGEIDSIKLTQDLKAILQGVLQRFSNHQLKLIKLLDASSTKSIQLLREKFNSNQSSQFQKLVEVRNQTKQIKNIFISSIEASTLECIKSIQDYAKQQIQRKNTEVPKAKSQSQKGKLLLQKILQKIREETEVILSEQKAEIEKKMKGRSQSYLERAKLNKKDNQQWFGNNFLNSYEKDLKEIRNIVQNLSGQFCMKIDEMIVKADNKMESVIVKKKLSRTQSK